MASERWLKRKINIKNSAHIAPATKVTIRRNAHCVVPADDPSLKLIPTMILRTPLGSTPVGLRRERSNSCLI
jgi:hypothetical protein